RVVAAQLQMAELGGGDEYPVREQGAADAGAEGQHDDGAPVVAARAEVHLGDAGGVRVVDHGHRQAAETVAEQDARVGVDPALVYVGGGTDGGAVGDHAGEGDADRAGPAEVVDDLLD